MSDSYFVDLLINLSIHIRRQKIEKYAQHSFLEPNVAS